MRILGIDPGLATVGFGLVECCQKTERLEAIHWGAIQTKPGRPDAERLWEIFEDFQQLLKQFQPDCVSIEKIFFFKNAKTLVPVSQARGVLLMTVATQRLAIHEYTPMQVKQAMTGYGKSTKQEIQEMAAQLLNLPKPPKPDDAADALALAICHSRFLKQVALTEGLTTGTPLLHSAT